MLPDRRRVMDIAKSHAYAAVKLDGYVEAPVGHYLESALATLATEGFLNPKYQALVRYFYNREVTRLGKPNLVQGATIPVPVRDKTPAPVRAKAPAKRRRKKPARRHAVLEPLNTPATGTELPELMTPTDVVRARAGVETGR